MFFTLPIISTIKNILIWFINLFPDADATISQNLSDTFLTLKNGLITWSAIIPINYLLFVTRLHIAMIIVYLSIRFAMFVLRNISLGHLGK